MGTVGPESYIPSVWSSLCHIAHGNTRAGQEQTAVPESCSSWVKGILGISNITGVEGCELRSKKMCQGQIDQEGVSEMFPFQFAVG